MDEEQEPDPDRKLEQRIGAGEHVAMLFTAAWCPAGRILAGQLADEESVELIDSDDRPSVADRFQVVSLPTLVVYRSGLEQGRLLGAFSVREAQTLLRRGASETIEMEPEATRSRKPRR